MPPKTKPTLEREVITAVITLYLLLCGMLLGMHYWRLWQPDAQKTVTSSSSPSHEHMDGKKP
jgi:hypothetical protein